MKIVYFSATGNSLYVAKRIGGELYAIPELIKKNELSLKDEVIGLVFPVFWISVPAYVRDFLKKAEFDCKYLFGIMTYGDNMFGAIYDLNTIALKNGRKFNYINTVKMTENYLPMYEMNKEIEKAEEYQTEDSIKTICNDIEKRINNIPGNSWFSKMLTHYFKKKHCATIGEGEASNFFISDECIGCGQCVRVCPMENIELIDGLPKFGKTCADCLGCIQNCPKTAIHTKKEKSDIRYRNPNIKIVELQNN